MAEAVIDQFEAVDVDEQHGTADARIAHPPLQHLVDAIHEQRSIRQPGQPVMQRIVVQLPLRGTAVGDV